MTVKMYIYCFVLEVKVRKWFKLECFKLNKTDKHVST